MLRKKKTWEEIRSKGQMHFIITQGLMGWGIPTAIIFFSITKLLEYGLEFTLYFNGESVEDLLLSLIFFQIGGIFFGWSMWRSGENKHQDRVSK